MGLPKEGLPHEDLSLSLDVGKRDTWGHVRTLPSDNTNGRVFHHLEREEGSLSTVLYHSLPLCSWCGYV